MKENYQKILDETIAGLEEKGEVPKLLLHSCCAPCSSYVLEYLFKPSLSIIISFQLFLYYGVVL